MFTVLLLAFLAAQTADTATTAWRLSHGFHEVNPFLPYTTGKILAVKASYTVGTATLAWKFRTTHPKAAKTLLVIGAALGTVATVHNARVRR